MSETSTHIVVEATREAASRLAAARIAELATAAVEVRGRFTMAIPGGTTPLPLFHLLAKPPVRDNIPWWAVQLYWVDERCVPPDDPDSNYGAAHVALLQHVFMRPEQIHRIHGEDPDPAHAAEEYARELPAHLDLMVLGIGEDGHIASLFPRSPALEEMERRAVAVITAAKPPPQRITITPPVVAAARYILVLVAGEEKSVAVARALEGPLDITRTPAQLARRGEWYLDKAAAAKLGKR